MENDRVKREGEVPSVVGGPTMMSLHCSGDALTSVERGDGWPGLFLVRPFLGSFGDDDGDGEDVSLVVPLSRLRPSLANFVNLICT